MNKAPAVVLVLGALVVGWAVFFRGGGESSSEHGKMVPLSQPIVFEGEVKANPTSDKAIEPPPNSATMNLKEVIPPKAEMPFEYKKELEAFNDMKKRLFLSESDLAEKRRLLNDVGLLRALGLRLTEPSIAPAVVQSQDDAVDLLVEALKSGDKETASEVMKSVVEDSQVENPSLDPRVREQMAGVKGEIMLRWAALMPGDSASIERSLPGPVSKKIWANVKKRHDSNEAESAEEAAKR